MRGRMKSFCAPVKWIQQYEQTLIMKKNILFLFLTVLTFGFEIAYSEDSIPKSLPIEKKVNYYLGENLECREVVNARDTTIDSLKAINAATNKAIEVSKLEAAVSRRVVLSLQDSVASTNRKFQSVQEQFYTENRRKKRWRKCFLISSVIVAGEFFIIYTKTILW